MPRTAAQGSNTARLGTTRPGIPADGRAASNVPARAARTVDHGRTAVEAAAEPTLDAARRGEARCEWAPGRASVGPMIRSLGPSTRRTGNRAAGEAERDLAGLAVTRAIYQRCPLMTGVVIQI